eukprot:CAMPEP_0177542010 /NCGR_PEP_ID=MMETSP0369-20130122/60539_1 /TAXON_ID=447022 ORGANISM="Scrippsiella hangoei-like, Strain SHHI-4" /NCGR_SAMPLE_ID=MMETSP0369 /ASSEMBLY_ACC=CAM_ASM_000364 /LENGTH=110 /DNA_ID=CAMNT_0019025573 /DNA_START=81 /DNA_END=410 /DNA_ORIENTATION=-
MTHDHGGFPELRAYSAALKVCADSQQWEWAVQMLQNLQRAQGQPSAADYTSLVGIAMARQDLKLVLTATREMSQLRLEGDACTYKYALRACEEFADWKWSLKLFQEMRCA